MAETPKKQQVELHRKLRLRMELMEKAGELTGAFYIPFIGEGDIAVALYNKNDVYGADIEPAMVTTAKFLLPNANILTADCDVFPFPDYNVTYSLADFDSYSYPYKAFRSFWKGAKIAPKCVLIFTDGQKQAIIKAGSYTMPNGKKLKLKTSTEKRTAFNFYFKRIIEPWFTEYIKPYEIVYITRYLRSGSMCYWGAIIALPGKGSIAKAGKGDDSEITPYKFDDVKKGLYIEHISNGHTRGYAATLVGIHRSTVVDHMKVDKEFAAAVSEAEGDAIGKVENALFKAATSGNITAQQVYLYNRDPNRWTDRRNVRLAGEGGGPIEVAIDAKYLSDEELIAIIERIERVKGRRSKGTPK